MAIIYLLMMDLVTLDILGIEYEKNGAFTTHFEKLKKNYPILAPRGGGMKYTHYIPKMGVPSLYHLTSATPPYPSY